MKVQKRWLILGLVTICLVLATAIYAAASGGFSFSEQSPSPGGITNSNPRISAMVVADANLVHNSARVKINGVTYTATFHDWYTPRDGEIFYNASNLADGLYNVEVSIKDVNNNEGMTAWQFTVRVPPVISELTPANNSSHRAVSVIRAKAVDPNGTINPASIGLKLNGVTVAHSFDPATGYISYNPETLADGNHTVNLYVEDNSGNSRTAAWSFKTDNSPPVFSSASPVNGAKVNNMSPEVSIYAADLLSHLDNTTVKMYLNGVQVTPAFAYDYTAGYTDYDYQKGTISYRPSNLADGNYPVIVEIADKAGNVSTFSWQFTVAVPPNISNQTPANNSTHIFVGEVSAVAVDPNGSIDPLAIIMKVNNVSVPTTFNSATGKIAYSIPDGLPNATHSVFLEVADMAGNKRTASWSFTVNATPPEFKNLTPAPGGTVTIANPLISVSIEDPDGIKSGTPKMFIDGTQVAAVFTYYQYYNQYWEWVADYTKGTLSFTPEALQNGQRQIRVEARDEAGNLGSATWNVTVAAPPKIQQITPAVNATLASRRPVIDIDYYSNEALSLANIAFKVNGQAVAPVLTSLGAYQGRITYQTPAEWENEAAVNLTLTLTSPGGLVTTQGWSYNINTYGEMAGTGKNRSTCALCHDHYAIKNPLCYECHLWEVANWEPKCFDCHQPGWPKTHYRSGYPHDTVPDHQLTAEDAGGCTACHARTLTREHIRKDYSCATCHVSGTRERNTLLLRNREGNLFNVARRAAGNRDCFLCHTGEAASLVHPEHKVNIGAKCQECHSNDMMTETVYHNNNCGSCHSSRDETVRGAIRWQKNSCFDCHTTAHGIYMTEYRDDIPLYSGLSWTVPDAASVWENEGWLPAQFQNEMARIIFSGRSPALQAGTVHNYYTSEMAAGNWELVSDSYAPGMDYFELVFQKGRRQCAVWFFSGTRPNAAGNLPAGARIIIVYH